MREAFLSAMHSRYLHVTLQGTTRDIAPLHIKECWCSHIRYKETNELWKDIVRISPIPVAYSGEAHSD
jgi:hypothetical protein